MPRTLFPQGIPTNALSGRARSIAEELDNGSLIARSNPSTRGDGKVDADEIRWALSQADGFDADTRAAVKDLATALGVDAPNAAPVKREWQDRTTEKLDTPVAAMAMGDRAVVLDGSSSEEYPILRVYNPGNDQWTKIDLPQQLFGKTKASSVATDDKGLYFVAGDYSAGTPIGWTLRYDDAARSWSWLPENPRPADHAATASLNGNLVVAGGANTFFNAKPVATVQMFDASQGQWTSLPDLPVARTGASALAVGGKLVVVGGTDANYQTLDRVDIYDPATGRWQDPALRVATAVQRPSLWAEGNVLHVTGGMNNLGRANTNHDTVDLTTGKLDDGVPLPAGALRLDATRVGDRVFAFGMMPGNHYNPFTKEWAPAKGQGGAGDGGAGGDGAGGGTTIIDNNTFNLQVVNVDLTQVTQTVNNFVDLSTAVTQNVTVNDTRLSLTPIPLGALAEQSDGKTSGFYDPDGDFFLRTKSNDRPLLRLGSDASGQRFLVGLADAGKSAVPRGRGELFAYHAATRTLIPFKSDAQGQFAIPLPAGISGPLQIFAMKGGVASGAGTVAVP
jgi:hypothetical protein